MMTARFTRRQPLALSYELLAATIRLSAKGYQLKAKVDGVNE